jgi:predicted nucleic acid-binding protein
MADETKPAATTVFLDTSLIVAATVEVHPSYATAAEYVDNIIADGGALYISPQVCREFLVVLTRQPVSGRVFTVAEAHLALSVWMTGCTVLEEGEAVLSECLALGKQFQVRGKQVHDCNIVATMRVHAIGALATRNPADFKRYAEVIEVVAVA